MADGLEQLIRQLGRLGPQESRKAQEFLYNWNLFKGRFPAGFPEDKLWVNFVANHSERAQLFGVTVNPRHHLPFVQLRCPAPCPLCDRPAREAEKFRKEVEEEELRKRILEQPSERLARSKLQDQSLREVQELERREQVTAALGRRFEQAEKAVETKKGFRKKEEKRIAEEHERFHREVEKNPRLGEILGVVQKFLAGWGSYLDVRGSHSRNCGWPT